jgi:hypothetical protein
MKTKRRRKDQNRKTIEPLTSHGPVQLPYLRSVQTDWFLNGTAARGNNLDAKVDRCQMPHISQDYILFQGGAWREKVSSLIVVMLRILTLALLYSECSRYIKIMLR